MQDKPSSGDDVRAATTVAEDRQDQAAVLGQVLSLSPQALTITELIREMNGGKSSFARSDQTQRAIRDLVAGGLLHLDRETVRPTRAAVLFYELVEL